MRSEVATALIFLFIPTFVMVVSARNWQRCRGTQWPPPLALLISTAVVLALLITIWHASTGP